MDSIKSSVQGVTKEATQPAVPDKHVKDYPICIFRTQDALSNQKQVIAVKYTLGIVERIRNKRKFFGCKNHKLRPICPASDKCTSILRKFFSH